MSGLVGNEILLLCFQLSLRVLDRLSLLNSVFEKNIKYLLIYIYIQNFKSVLNISKSPNYEFPSYFQFYVKARNLNSTKSRSAQSFFQNSLLFWSLSFLLCDSFVLEKRDSLGHVLNRYILRTPPKPVL